MPLKPIHSGYRAWLITGKLTWGKLIIFTGIMDSSNLHRTKAQEDVRSGEDNEKVKKPGKSEILYSIP